MTYRPIDVAGRPVKYRDAGPLPELHWLQLDRLVIDNDFQRPLGRANWIAIGKIEAAFSWSSFTPVVVAPIGDGRFSIIDGQHRCHAARLVGVEAVPCMVVQLSVSEQAAAFTAINGTVTAITPANIYRAALVARTPWAIACQQCVADAGAKLMTFNAASEQKKPGQLFCVMLIRKHVEAGRGAMVTAALKAMWSAKGASDPRVWSNAILTPWLDVLQANPRAARRDLGPFMAAHDILAIERKVDRMRATEAYRQTSHVVLMRQVLTAVLLRWMAEADAA